MKTVTVILCLLTLGVALHQMGVEAREVSRRVVEETEVTIPAEFEEAPATLARFYGSCVEVRVLPERCVIVRTGKEQVTNDATCKALRELYSK